MVGTTDQVKIVDIDANPVAMTWKRNGLFVVCVIPFIAYFLVGKSVNWEISDLLTFSADYNSFSIYILVLGLLGMANYFFLLKRMIIESPCIRSTISAQEDVVISSRFWSLQAASLCASIAILGICLNFQSHATLLPLLLATLSPIIYHLLIPNDDAIKFFIRRKVELFNAGKLPKQ